ncbi:MAG: DNA polymerase III subunit beta, partial [Synergistaceae bacterium]|nr:DNA polymerase III subunit beta [Synergistaceae bacterium]
MKLEIKRQDFLKALQTTEKIAAVKAIEDLENSIKLNANYDGVTIEATDLKTTVKSKVNPESVNLIEPGTAVLPLAILGGMLKKSKCDTAAI